MSHMINIEKLHPVSSTCGSARVYTQRTENFLYPTFFCNNCGSASVFKTISLICARMAEICNTDVVAAEYKIRVKSNMYLNFVQLLFSCIIFIPKIIL